jgi:glycosyltransferase involved in cell wall biosynthesis
MTPIQRIALIGNSLPRRCGIATFTTDLQQAVAAASPSIVTSIIAMSDRGRSYDYPPSVGFEVGQETLSDYVAAADYINAGRFDAVSLQHEFGIFGGEAGGHILALLERLTVPIIVTFHTVLAEPSLAQRRVLERIMVLSARVIVMAEKGRALLLGVYGGNADKIDVIPHGIPDFPFVEPDAAKAALGFRSKAVALTFGLLSPNKGIEVMIDAMPAVLESRPDTIYVVLGATHPNLVRDQGEAYRDSLVARAAALGLGEHVIFRNQFVDRETLLEYIAACDVYVTPYLHAAQMTSGTLAYSFGLGKAVVSTPYWHAVELLADGRGCIVPFGDSQATGATIAELLTDEPRRHAMRRRAYDDSRSMIWERVAERYLAVFDAVKSQQPSTRLLRPTPRVSAPEVALDHLRAMTDDTGMFQHAIHAVPDRAHGYCVDDNARGLLLSTSLQVLGEERLPEHVIQSYAAFVQHAFNRATGRFRNFMSFDRRWLEPQGSEDSHGRTLWALGAVARHDHSGERRRWAADLFATALTVVDTFASPRAWAFTLLGLDAYCAAAPEHEAAAQMRVRLADRLLALLQQVETADWTWFEESLSYDNARLCEAMILAGKATGTRSYADAGLRSLGWLTLRQTSPTGLFRPIGTEAFHRVRSPGEGFDQQPLEATASIAASLAALRHTSDSRWRKEAHRAFAWFVGGNDLSQSLVDVETGSCRDGLHPDRRNENRGGESVVSYLLALADIRQLDRQQVSVNTSKVAAFGPRLVPKPTITQPRGSLAASHLPQSAGPLPQT